MTVQEFRAVCMEQFNKKEQVIQTRAQTNISKKLRLALEDVEETLKLVYLKDCIVPGKIAMGFGKSIAEESVKGRINAMPGLLYGTRCVGRKI